LGLGRGLDLGGMPSESLKPVPPTDAALDIGRAGTMLVAMVLLVGRLVGAVGSGFGRGLVGDEPVDALNGGRGLAAEEPADTLRDEPSDALSVGRGLVGEGPFDAPSGAGEVIV
jgi:hypothetical protein